MSMKSGWCQGPPGTVIPHEACRWDLCQCECHSHPEPMARRTPTPGNLNV